jgi:hypothetical protein
MGEGELSGRLAVFATPDSPCDAARFSGHKLLKG